MNRIAEVEAILEALRTRLEYALEYTKKYPGNSQNAYEDYDRIRAKYYKYEAELKRLKEVDANKS